jgi:putative ubiquitin-RnfH superfamily antitoxin RatB of RatAB toxin-antitoxin module
MANAEGPTATIVVELAWSPAPREMRTLTLRLPAQATVADALHASGWPELQAVRAGGELVTAVWGHARSLAHRLHDGDRVEVLRPLKIAPMEARRARFEAAGGVKELRKRRQEKQPLKGR